MRCLAVFFYGIVVVAASLTSAAPTMEQCYQGGISGALSYYDWVLSNFKTTGWWNSANIFNTLVDASVLELSRPNGNTTLVVKLILMLENSVNGFLLQMGVECHLSTGHCSLDDIMWWAIMYMRGVDLLDLAAAKQLILITDAQRLTKDFLNCATTAFDNVIEFGLRNPTCGGGTWWSSRDQYKNAITNELLLELAARLAQRAPDGRSSSYLASMQKQYQWLVYGGGSKMIGPNLLFNDGLTNPGCLNNGGVCWTYNQGVILAALAEVFQAQNSTLKPLFEAQRFANASMFSSVINTNSGVLREPCEPNCGADGCQFKGIYIRKLSYLRQLTLRHATMLPASLVQFANVTIASAIRRNAESVCSRAASVTSNGDVFFGTVWSGPATQSPGACQQGSGLDAVVAYMSL
jgi:predicted alpha-1,6-mannanase (GH76 family)